MAEVIEAAQAASSIQGSTGADPAAPKPKRAPRKPAAETAKASEEAAGTSTADTSATAKEGATAKKARATRDGNTEPWYVRKVQKSLERMANESKPTRKQKITLKTRHAQEMFTRGAQLWAETVLTLSVTMRNFKPEDQCLVVDAEVDRTMQAPADFIKAEFERLNALADSNGVDLSDITDVEYTNPAQYAMIISAPRERIFYDLLLEYDKLCVQMDVLWMSSLVTDRARSRSAYDVKRVLVRALYQARNLVFRAQASSDRNGIHKVQDPRNANGKPAEKVADLKTTAANSDSGSEATEAAEAEEALAVA